MVLYAFQNVVEVQNPSEFQKILSPTGLVRAFDKVCAHCQNSCTVTMDDSLFDEPCPWCEGGRLRGQEYATSANGVFKNRDGKTIFKPDWYCDVDVSVLSWNRGRTLYHKYVCESVWCNEAVSGVGVRCRSCVSGGSRFGRVLSWGDLLNVWRGVEHIRDDLERREAIRRVIVSKHERRRVG